MLAAANLLLQPNLHVIEVFLLATENDTVVPRVAGAVVAASISDAGAPTVVKWSLPPACRCNQICM